MQFSTAYFYQVLLIIDLSRDYPGFLLICTCYKINKHVISLLEEGGMPTFQFPTHSDDFETFNTALLT